MNDQHPGWKKHDLSWSLLRIRERALRAKSLIIEGDPMSATEIIDQICDIVTAWENDEEVTHAWEQLLELRRRDKDIEAGKNLLTSKEFEEKLEQLGKGLEDPSDPEKNN